MLVNGVEYKEHHTALCKGYARGMACAIEIVRGGIDEE